MKVLFIGKWYDLFLIFVQNFLSYFIGVGVFFSDVLEQVFLRCVRFTFAGNSISTSVVRAFQYLII